MCKRKEPFVRTLFLPFNTRHMDMADNTDSTGNGGDADNTGNTDNMGNAARADNSRRVPDTLRVAIVVCPSFIPPLGFHSLIAYAPKENVYRRVPSIYGQTQ